MRQRQYKKDPLQADVCDAALTLLTSNWYQADTDGKYVFHLLFYPIHVTLSSLAHSGGKTCREEEGGAGRAEIRNVSLFNFTNLHLTPYFMNYAIFVTSLCLQVICNIISWTDIFVIFKGPIVYLFSHHYFLCSYILVWSMRNMIN